ncbi:unnamed protein product, partial [Mesorhabditis belari]|uniref:EGF-like domain-containing protein n=1 Tax=Mesorhabditis belari TaxID=2138241 RepID=A0AAF3F5G0_9BILA
MEALSSTNRQKSATQPFTEYCNELNPDDPNNDGWFGEYPHTDNDDVCGIRAIFPTSDRCWGKWLGVSESELCDVGNGGVAKVNGTLYCGCAEGFQYTISVGASACTPIQPPCESCHFDCHISSKCLPLGDTSFVCARCNSELGFEDVSIQPGVQPGKSCRDVDECSKDNDCDQNAACVNQEVLSNSYRFKYTCICKKGWRGMNETGTKCHPCRDENECRIPGICGAGAECQNTDGSYICKCKDGYQKGPDGKCVDVDECSQSPCGRYSNCTNTEGSYICQCLPGFKDVPMPWTIKPQVNCLLDKEYHCKKCCSATTVCVETNSQFQCQCKKNHLYVDGQRCKPKVWCENNADCAPQPKGLCVELNPPGSGYKCKCQENYEGDGKKCIATNVCAREAPCTLVAHADCFSQNEKNYFCKCEPGYVRQMAEEGNPKAPCYSVNSSQVNNCSICDLATQDCRPVLDLLGQPDPNFKSCYCKDGYEPRKDGKPGCTNTNECLFEDMNNCDPIRARCIDKIPHLDGGLKFECKCLPGYKGPGTRNTCQNINECEENPKLPCAGQHMKCKDIVGSYECYCEQGYTMIAGTMVCLDVDECRAHPCPPNAECFNKDGSYECRCAKGFKSTGELLPDGNGTCIDVNECDEFPTLYNKSACNTEASTCRNTPGSWECECKRPFYKPCGEDCEGDSTCSDDKCVCGSCVDIDTPPYYKCLCPYGSFTPNDTICLDQKYCDGGDYHCGDFGECVDRECVCAENYEWLTFPGPYTPETMKDRPGCSPINLCDRQGCPASDMKCTPLDSHPFKRCECPLGTKYSRELVACIDIDECTEEVFKVDCPIHSHCHNYNGTYACECDPGFFNENIDPKTRAQSPLCKNKDECKNGQNNCSRIPNSFCKDETPGFSCQCKPGYFKSVDRTRSCGRGKHCLAETCMDVDECRNTICPEHSKCHNTDGSYYCECEPGYKMENGVCCRVNYCNGEGGGHNCTRFEKCVLTENFFKCECIEGYEHNLASNNCTWVPICDTPKDTCKPRNMKCIDDATNGRHVCQCGQHQKFINNKCIDIVPCTLYPCPKGDQNICKNDKTQADGYRCDCAKDYKKNPKCAGHPNNCSCIPENLCEKYPCRKDSQCQWKNGERVCKCNDGFAMAQLKEECLSTDGCTLPNGKPRCSPSTEDCQPTGPGAARCICKTDAIQVGEKCVPNPCNNNTACPVDATKWQTFDKNGVPICTCQCPTGMSFENGKCTQVDPCGCRPLMPPCKKATACESAEQECRVWDGEAHCDCPIGYQYDPVTKTCPDYNECKNNTFCPPDTSCKNLEGSYQCICLKRGQVFDPIIQQCIPDTGCSEEAHCSDDLNKKCQRVGNDQIYCVCQEPYQGSGKPGEPCTPIDYCNLPQYKNICGNVTGSVKIIDPIGKTCKCSCKNGCEAIFEAAESSKVKECRDIDECSRSPQICANRLNTKCQNNANLCGGYDCVCLERYQMNNQTSACEAIDYCKERRVNCGSNAKCEPRTGACKCDPGYQWDHITKQCIDINECDLWPCKEHELCNNLVGSYECLCDAGFVRLASDGPCVDDNECAHPVKPCPEHSVCQNLIGGFRCDCNTGYFQNGEFDCATNSTICDTCPVNSHCIRTIAKNTIYNCTCDDGFRLDGTECKNINECDELKPCHKNATCTDLIPGYKCECNKPLVGNGVTDCSLPDFCDPQSGYLDCPADSKCSPKYPGYTSKKGKLHYVDCKCTLSGFKFNEETRTCEDINECDKPDACPTKAVCNNKIGSYECLCSAGYAWNPDTNQCDNINECHCTAAGCYDKNKCSMQVGRCQDTDGSWTCVCNANYGHPKSTNDSQTCERITYCRTELDDCDKETTVCKETDTGFICVCKGKGLRYVPNTNNKKCEDINECIENTHTCGPFQQCTNKLDGFYCNCTNDIPTNDPNTCAPVSDCPKPLDCGPYGFSKMENGQCRCKCNNRYQWNEKEQTCIPYNSCDLAYECPLNSDCKIVQRQNETKDGSPGAAGTYAACVCRTGYEMINFQCHQNNICKEQPTICGLDAQCLPDSIEPYKNTLVFVPTEQWFIKRSMDRGVRKLSDCDKRNPCDPNSAICSVMKSSVRCDCKPGFEGIGTLESPCLPVKICEKYNPCSKFAHCTEANGVARCECNKGYTGNGTYCKDVNECDGVNDCFPGALCTNTQGSYVCKCPEDYEGDGKTCTPIKYCENKLDKCDRRSTNCQQEKVGYTCQCKGGFKKSYNNKYQCDDIDECHPMNPCPIHAATKIPHKCINSIGSYSCECSNGYVNIDSTHCKDVDECTHDPCLANSECINLEGTFKCLCDEGYNRTVTGEGPLDYCCDIFPICEKRPEICDRAVSTCNMVPYKPAYTCDCKPGYAKKDPNGLCEDIDECTSDAKVIDHMKNKGSNVTCTNKIGSYELNCKIGYKSVEDKTTELLVCGPVNECAEDPAYTKALDVIEQFKKKVMNKEPVTMNDLTKSLPSAEKLDSAYAKCLETQRFPMCVDFDYESGSNTQLFEEESPDELKEYKGFGCRCADGSDPTKNGDWMECQQSICRCLGANVDPKCMNGVPGQCQCKQDPVKKYYKRYDKAGNLYCSENQCDVNTNLIAVANGFNTRIKCENGRLIVPAGWEIVEGSSNQMEYMIKDIDECAKSNPCCDDQNCKGPNCVKCFNTPGSYECKISTTSGDFSCVSGKFDGKTCLCAEAVCNVKKAWFYDCTGCNVTSRTFANDNRSVCSNILKEDGSGFKTFKSMKDLLASTCDVYLNGGQGYCAMNIRGDANKTTDQPTFNYFGECNEAVAPKCESGVVPSRTSTISGLPKELYICYYGPTNTYGDVPAGATTTNVISTLSCQNQFSSKNWAFQQIGNTLEQKKVKVA